MSNQIDRKNRLASARGMVKPQKLASLRRLRALRDKGSVIITGHDPEMWRTIPQAPARLTVPNPTTERS